MEKVILDKLPIEKGTLDYMSMGSIRYNFRKSSRHSIASINFRIWNLSCDEITEALIKGLVVSWTFCLGRQYFEDLFRMV